MKVKDIVETLNLEVTTCSNLLDKEIKSGFVGDLLSVVMGNAKEGCCWVTIQSHLNVVGVASLVDAACVIVAEGFSVDEDAIQKANEEEVIFLKSKLSSYEICANLAKLGI